MDTPADFPHFRCDAEYIFAGNSYPVIYKSQVLLNISKNRPDRCPRHALPGWSGDKGSLRGHVNTETGVRADHPVPAGRSMAKFFEP